jgi:hypothetical protein
VPIVAPRLLYPALALLGGMLLWLGLRNQPDPMWVEADAQLHRSCPMIDQAVDSLANLYVELHGRRAAGHRDSGAFHLLARPYLRTLAYDKFAEFCRYFAQQRFVVVSGVTGTGSTKLAEKATRFLASDLDSCILTIQCAPEFDLDFHKKYIGTDDAATGQFQPGQLLDFWDRCRRHPKQRFVCMVDNFDKINPETFFGPQLWELLGTSKEIPVMGGQRISIPPNFYLLSVTHLGPGSRVEFNEEHFKRLGRQYIVEPNACELLDYFRRQAVELAPKAKTDSAVTPQLEALVSTANQRRLVFYFFKSNQIIRQRYGVGYELGQGSNVRRYFMPDQLPELKNTYLNHINSLGLSNPLTIKDFEPLDETVANHGLEPGTNFLARQVQWLGDTGYLVEITMVGATALLTTLIGWWLMRRRERLIRNYGQMAQDIFSDFEDQKVSGDEAARRLESIKNEVNDLVLRRRLNYTEGLYFMAFVEDKMRRIDFARNVSENFLELFNAFMEDNVLTENEYLKLRQFLQSMWHKIPDETYNDFAQRVERAYDKPTTPPDPS